MRVHIACKDDHHIVPRMMRWLVEGAGWSMGNHTDPSADVNYYAPYTMYSNYGRVGTLMTGWFTHFESANPSKVDIWKQAREAFHQRLITSPVYEDDLSAYGRVTRVTPGIDTDLFAVSKKKRKAGIIGVAGVGSGRKGTMSVQTLFNNYGGDLLVAGHGYGVPVENWFEYQDMPTFYNQLDVFVCPATEEGIPAPVLEALACGCKVVMFAGVGIAELIAPLPGVFIANTLQENDLLETIEKAIGTVVDRHEVSTAVNGFNKAAWVESNVWAINQLLDRGDGYSDERGRLC